MHCPKCGLQIDSEELSFCSRCGQTLGLIRAAMTADQPAEMALEARGSSVNLGVVMMFVGIIPAIFTILFVNSNVALSLSILILITAYLGLLFGSDPLMKAFRTDETSFSELVHREVRKEMMLGSTLMLIGIVLATCLVAVLPGPWEKIGFIVVPLLVFVTILLSSGWIKNSMWEILGAAPSRTGFPAKTMSPTSVETGDLLPIQIGAGAGTPVADFRPPSVTEATTNLLKDER